MQATDLTFTTANYDGGAKRDGDGGERHRSGRRDGDGAAHQHRARTRRATRQDWDYAVGVTDDDSGTINVTSFERWTLDEDSATESEKAKAYGVTLSVIPAGDGDGVRSGIKDSDNAVTLSATSPGVHDGRTTATAQSVTVTAATRTRTLRTSR